MDVVRCPGCGEENPSRFRLCGYCGTSLTLPVVASVSCPACGSENPAGFRFCGFCGTVLDPQRRSGPGGPPGDPMHGGHPGAPGYGLPPWAWWAVRWAPPWSPPGGYGAPTPPGWPAPPPGWGAAASGLGSAASRLGPAGAAAGYPEPPIRRPAIRRPDGPPGSPPPGWGAPPPGWGQPGGWSTPPAGSPPAGWAPPAAQPPPSQPPTPPPPVPTDAVTEQPIVAPPPPPPPVARPHPGRRWVRRAVGPGLASEPALPPAEPPSRRRSRARPLPPPQPAAPAAAVRCRPPRIRDARRLPGLRGASPRAAALPSQEIRKVVTIIFSDLQGQHRAHGADRRRGDQRGQGALLRVDGGRDHATRRQDREVHRRRDHGRVRAAASPRGRRPARRPRGPRHDPGDGATQRRPARGSTGSRSRLGPA